LTYNLDFQFLVSCCHDPYNSKNINVKGQADQRLEWKQTDGQTDVRTGGQALNRIFSFLANVLGKYYMYVQGLVRHGPSPVMLMHLVGAQLYITTTKRHDVLSTASLQSHRLVHGAVFDPLTWPPIGYQA